MKNNKNYKFVPHTCPPIISIVTTLARATYTNEGCLICVKLGSLTRVKDMQK